MKTYICDIEADNLLIDATKIHCLVMMNYETEEVRVFDDEQYTITSGLKLFEREDITVVFHNACGYDIPLIEKLYPNMSIKCKIIDTLILSRLTQLDRDRHSIESYGEEFGVPKPEHEDWSKYTPEMKHRCVEDVKIGKLVYDKVNIDVPYEIEQEVQLILSRQELNGWKFDVKKAEKLHMELLIKKQEIYETLIQHTPPVIQRGKEFTPKRDNSRLGYLKDCPMTKISVVTFNPSSRQHIIYLLKTKYGHEFTQFTEKGNEIVNEKTIEELPYEELRPLKEYFQVNKVLGFISEGDNAWLKMVKENNRIHHYCNGLGTVTGRGSHSSPNLGQVPSGKKYLGNECRELFTVDKGKVLVGCDLSGLELRCLAHYLYPFDKGLYAREVLEGDIHTANQNAAGLTTRDQAKTFIYGFLYGAGNAKIGSIIGKGAKAGANIKRKFFNKMPAVKKLIDLVQKASKRGYIKGINDRHVRVRSSHSALNFLLQSLGAYIAKQWIIEFHKEMSKHNVEFKQVGWIHDEIQVECNPEDADLIGGVLVECAKKAGEHFKLRVPIDAEYDVGNNWKETH